MNYNLFVRKLNYITYYKTCLKTIIFITKPNIMNAYFFKMNKEERDNILDQHKHAYDGYVTRYNQENNETPLYVQDFANDKGGVTVNNKGVVKNYTNMNINESMLDTIGDGPMDLKNGTVDLDSIDDTMSTNHEMMHDVYPSPNEDEYISLWKDSDDIDSDDMFEYDIDEMEDYSTDELYEMYHETEVEEDDQEPNKTFFDEVDEDQLPEFIEKLNESLDMFRRFNKYN